MTVDSNKDKNVHTLSIAFDFIQNIQLLQIPVQEIFYLRQLAVKVVCIHDKKKHLVLLLLALIKSITTRFMATRSFPVTVNFD
jgi:hypothetical protein